MTRMPGYWTVRADRDDANGSTHHVARWEVREDRVEEAQRTLATLHPTATVRTFDPNGNRDERSAS